MTLKQLVIVGAGMAGTRLMEEVIARDPSGSWQITVVGDEPDAPYNRILLSEVLAGKHERADLDLLPPGGVGGERVTQILGTRVMTIHRSTSTVHLSDQRILNYDALVLATGSTPILPPLPGLYDEEDWSIHPQCFAFRTLEDCRGIMQAASNARRAVVIGGGLLGLEAARGLLGQGLDVEIVHMGEWLMDAQLDSEGGEVLGRTLASMGITTYLEARARSIEVTRDGSLVGVKVADGHVLECDLVVFAAGVRANTRLAKDCRLSVERGIVVDDRMRTDDPQILAIGDCAQADGKVLGLVGPAWDQAAVVARNLTDPDGEVHYEGSRIVTRLKASGIEVAALGETQPMPKDSNGELEVVSFSDYARGIYKKVVLRDGRVCGGILLGDAGTVGNLMLAMDRGTKVPRNRLPLLFEGLTAGSEVDASAAPDYAVLCHCNNVTHGQVRDAITSGACQVSEIAHQTRATTGCGTCRRSVEELIACHDLERKPA
ncbi:MAG: FAD-dependent oxidoreductase [Candidatus Nanopelagicales bacterium]